MCAAYICLYAGHGSPRYRLRLKDSGPSVPRISDQRPARPKQQHQHDTEQAQHGKNRLIQHDPDDAGPEPGRMAFCPGPQSLLAGLMDIVPQLAELREPQVLIGDPARAIIDHEDETAGQQQQPDKSEETADHSSPVPAESDNAVSQYPAGAGNSTSSAPYRPARSG